jgi:hypothetical protein
MKIKIKEAKRIFHYTINIITLIEVLCTIVKVRLNLQHTFTIIIFASALSLMVLCDATIIKYISSTAMYDL